MALSRRQQLWNLAMQAAALLGDVEDNDERGLLAETFAGWVEEEVFVRVKGRELLAEGLDRRLLGDSMLAANVGLTVTRRSW